jgi:hypothetical protein
LPATPAGAAPDFATGRPRRKLNGIASKVVPASVIIAATHPAALMIACTSGANTTWPSELPALMKPPANARRSGGSRYATPPIRMPKLPAPAPHAVRMPNVSTKPHSLVTNGVIAVPSASIRQPAITTRTVPYLSAIAPKIGCEAPQTSCPIAIARLILTTPNPVAVLSGETNRPVVTREPIVIIRIAAAASIRIHASRAE